MKTPLNSQKTFVKILTLFAVCSASLIGNSFSAPPAPKSLAGASVSIDRLKKAVADSEARLGGLLPWQKKIFDEEVLTQPQRFVRDYRASAKGGGAIDADVDSASIKNYLSFHSSQVMKGGGKSTTQPSLWYWVGAEPGCLKCAAALPGVKKMIANRVSNRGFRALDAFSFSASSKKAVVTTQDGDDDSDVATAGDASSENQKVKTLLSKTKKVFEIPGRSARETSLKETSEQWYALKNVAGVLFVYLQLAPQDDVDSVHADEKRYLTLMHFGTSSERVNGVFGFSSEFESMENDALDQSVLRLYLDAMTELGVQTAKHVASVKSSNHSSELSANQDGASLQLKITSVRSYGHYSRAKAEIQAALQDLSLKISEREFSRGQAIWILRAPDSDKPLSTLNEEVKKRVGGIAKEKLKVSSVQSSEKGISVELAH